MEAVLTWNEDTEGGPWFLSFDGGDDVPMGDDWSHAWDYIGDTAAGYELRVQFS